LWIFPKVKNIEPNYDQKTFDPADRINKLQEIVSPVKNGNGVTINQDAWLHLGNLKQGFKLEYNLKQKGNGVYVFIIKGDVSINDQQLEKRDGYGLWEVDQFSIIAKSEAEVLLIEVPMV
jgi:redox-sensitive bicupin YhaK (pirin superfamily)